MIESTWIVPQLKLSFDSFTIGWRYALITALFGKSKFLITN